MRGTLYLDPLSLTLIVIPAKILQGVMAGLAPAIFFHAADARIKSAHDVLLNRHGRALTRPSSVPLIQFHTLRRSKLDPDFRQGDEEK